MGDADGVATESATLATAELPEVAARLTALAQSLGAVRGARTLTWSGLGMVDDLEGIERAVWL